MHIVLQMLILFQDFVRDHYLEYKATDDTTVMFDPEKTSFWFSLGPRALVECNQMMVLLRVGGVSIQFIIVIKKIYTYRCAWCSINL